jgi:hypothetical protein
VGRPFSKLLGDMKAIVTNSARHAAVEMMNDLVTAGPGYSGQFSSAWYAVLPGQAPGGPRSTGGRLYKYDMRNVPIARFKSGVYYEIVNGADYAPQALDLEPGFFIGQEEDPIKTPVTGGRGQGSRTGSYRYNVTSGDGDAFSTAPKDWYVTYTQGGMLQRSLANGVKIGFREGPKGSTTASGEGFA